MREPSRSDLKGDLNNRFKSLRRYFFLRHIGRCLLPLLPPTATNACAVLLRESIELILWRIRSSIRSEDQDSGGYDPPENEDEEIQFHG